MRFRDLVIDDKFIFWEDTRNTDNEPEDEVALYIKIGPDRATELTSNHNVSLYPDNRVLRVVM